MGYIGSAVRCRGPVSDRKRSGGSDKGPRKSRRTDRRKESPLRKGGRGMERLVRDRYRYRPAVPQKVRRSVFVFRSVRFAGTVSPGGFGPIRGATRRPVRRTDRFGKMRFRFLFSSCDSFKNVKHSVIFENRSAPGRADRKTTRQRTPSDGRADAGSVRRYTLFFKCLTMIKLMRHLQWTFVGKTKMPLPPPQYADAAREIFVRPTCKRI